MHGPGESLKQEREARGKTIEEMAEATGIRPHFLTALELEAFDSLPGRGFGKLYIRAYAEVLGFDPRPVIEAYDEAVRGRQVDEAASEGASVASPLKAMLARWRQERIAARAEGDFPPEEELPEDEAEPEPAAPPLPVDAGRSKRWLVAASLALVLLPLAAYLVLVLRSSTPDPPPVAARNEPVPAEAVAPPPSQVPRTPPAAPSHLEVAESGLGEGEGNRFRAGQRVTFSTRVLGGGPGDSIRHVWLRDGKVEQSIRLRVDGASWRTHSTKTLGRPGAWAVEARDEQGRVLARADFTALP